MKFLYFLILFWPLVSSFKLNEEHLNFTDFSITSTRIPKQEKTKRSTSQICIPLLLKHNEHTICITISPNINNFFSKQETKITIANASLKSSDLDFDFAKGYVQNFEDKSYVDGYIEDDSFYGRIIVNNTIHYAEKLINFPHIIKKNNLKSLYGTIIYSLTPQDQVIIEDIIRANLKKYDVNSNIKKNICPILVIIDNSFIKYIANNNIKIAIATVVNSMERVDTIFRSTDFNNDGVPENVGFRIKEIVIHPVGYILKYKNRDINAKLYLYKLLIFPKLKEVCIGVAFTAQQFQEKVIGLSYQATKEEVGGICSTGLSIHFNAIVITYMQKHQKNAQVTNDICLAHEIGHTFGSSHDDQAKCPGYLMAAKTPNKLHINNFRFSKCSRNEINRIYLYRKYCFEEDKSPFCGNGILEAGEECDCGSIFNCLLKDQCCARFLNKSLCKINRRFSCHPSQGLCCTSSCSIRNVKHLGFSCNRFQRKCNDKETECGINGKCIINTCHSNECFRIGLKECQCPENNEESLCYTCCEYDGKCLSSRNASKFVTSIQPDIIDKFQEHDVNKTKFDIVEEFCNNDTCVPVLFKRFPEDEYCLVNGNLGICKSNYVCTAKIIKYDMLPFTYLYKSNTVTTRVLRKCIIILVIIKFITV